MRRLFTAVGCRRIASTAKSQYTRGTPARSGHHHECARAHLHSLQSLTPILISNGGLSAPCTDVAGRDLCAMVLEGRLVQRECGRTLQQHLQWRQDSPSRKADENTSDFYVHPTTWGSPQGFASL